jgi:nicotinamide-nucleotide amidase
MWRNAVFPRLVKTGNSVILSRTLKTWGLSEARIDQLVGDFMSSPNPTLALYARPDGIHLRITAKTADREEAAKLLGQREAELRRILEDSVWGADSDTLEDMLSGLLLHKKLTVATAESFTGGLLSCSLFNAPQSRLFFKGGIIAMDNQTRTAFNIPVGGEGQANTASAAQMALLARQKFSSDIGIGVDGYAESANNIITGKAFVAIDFAQGSQNVALTYPGGSYQLVRRSVMHALFSLRKILLNI